ncbi:ammonium transporter Amt3 [Mayamaea pseudoterrestris]|nr:ammonium transporter Amt3 [Mayamaea pseudoterrestris]
MPPSQLWSRSINSQRRDNLHDWCLKQQQQSSDSSVNATIGMLECVANALLDRASPTGSDNDNNEFRYANQNSMTTNISNREFIHSVALILCAALVWFMQAGFCMLCAGAVRRKNLQNTLLKNLLDVSGAALAWYVLGYALAFGGDSGNASNNPVAFVQHDHLNGTVTSMTTIHPTTTFMGHANFFLIDLDPSNYILWFFQCSFGAASTTIIAGTLAERCQMTAYLLYALVLAGWVYPIVAHAVWSRNGWLSPYNDSWNEFVLNEYYDDVSRATANANVTINNDSNSSTFSFHAPLFGVGMVDFAGAGVVHLTGGVTALIATVILGPRRGRFHDETGRRLNKANEFPGHDMSLQMLGTIILWFGWIGFNMGSALMGDRDRGFTLVSLTGVNTVLSGGTAGITSLLWHYRYLDRTTGEPFFDLRYAMLGSLCGLAAITAGCGVMEPWAAVITGFVAGLLYSFSSKTLLRFRVDDAVDAIPVHMVSGCWGLISVGLLASPDYLQKAYNHARHPGWFYTLTSGSGSDATLLGAQLCGILFIIGWVLINMLPFFVFLDWKGWFRSEAMEEIVGLDRSFHGGLALLAGEEVVRPEYVTALHKKRKEGGLRKRRSRLKGHYDTESVHIELVDLDDNPIVDDSSAFDDEGAEAHSRARIEQ